MNILEKLNKKKDIYQFEFFGIGDYATNIDLQELFEDIETIQEYFENKNALITNEDEFIDYLYLKKFDMFSDIESSILESYKEKFNTCINLIKQYYSKYDNKAIINYLQDNAITLLETKKYNIITEVFDLCFKFHTACQKVIMYIAKNKTYLILNNFDNIKNIILKYDDICKEIFEKRHFHDFKQGMLKSYFTIIKFFIGKKQYNELINEIIVEIIKFSDEIFNNINEDNYLQHEFVYKDIYEFLKSIKHNDYLVLEKNLSKLDDIKNKYITKHGHEFSFEIPVNKLLEPFKDDKISLQAKFLQLTHMLNKDTKKIESIFTNIVHTSTPSLVDSVCSTSTPTDEYFTFSLQNTLNMIDYCYFPCLQYYICKERINDLISIMATMTQKVFEYYKLDFKELELDIDFNIVLNMLNHLFYAFETKNDYLIKGLCFSVSMFEMALIEKILRNLFIVVNKETYIKNDWSSLGNLLNEKNQTMVELLGIDNVKVLSYFLIKCNNIGFNYRNNFAHYKNIKSEDFNYSTILKINQILICIINQLSLNITE